MLSELKPGPFLKLIIFEARKTWNNCTHKNDKKLISTVEIEGWVHWDQVRVLRVEGKQLWILGMEAGKSSLGRRDNVCKGPVAGVSSLNKVGSTQIKQEDTGLVDLLSSSEEGPEWVCGEEPAGG